MEARGLYASYVSLEGMGTIAKMAVVFRVLAQKRRDNKLGMLGCSSSSSLLACLDCADGVQR